MNKWTKITPESTVGNCTFSVWKCGKIAKIHGQYTAESNLVLYESYDIGVIPPEIRPYDDSYGLSINGRNLSVVIVYSYGRVKIRPFLGQIVAGEGVFFEVIYPIE